MKNKSFDKAQEIFHQNDGILRTGRAKKLGITETTLARMYAAGLLVKEGRGLYRLANLDPLSNPDLVLVTLRIPGCVICLISSLNYFNLTTQIPYKVYVALPFGTKTPRVEYPPLEIVHLSKKNFDIGIEEHILDGVLVRIYCRERTVADCFKFRNKVGKGVALEALKDYLRQPNRDLEKLRYYARIDRMENIIRPYIEAAL